MTADHSATAGRDSPLRPRCAKRGALRSWARTALLLLPCLALPTCTTFHEKYYFREAADTSDDRPVFYRVSIDGYTFLSKSRYSAGFFDETAVESLFGEITFHSADETLQRDADVAAGRREKLALYRQAFLDLETARANAAGGLASAAKTGADVEPKRAVLSSILVDWKAAQDAYQAELDRTSGSGTQAVSEKGSRFDTAGKRFVLFMNSNNDAIAQAMGAIAEQESVVNDLVAISNAGPLRENQALKGRNELTLHINATLSGRFDALLARAQAATTAPALSNAVLEMLNALGLEAGASFESLDAARKWSFAHPDAFVARAAR